MRMPDKITIKEGRRIVLRQNLQISEGWVNGVMCEVLAMTPNCILVCKIGFPDKKNILSQELNKRMTLKVLLILYCVPSSQYS